MVDTCVSCVFSGRYLKFPVLVDTGRYLVDTSDFGYDKR